MLFHFNLGYGQTLFAKSENEFAHRLLQIRGRGRDWGNRDGRVDDQGSQVFATDYVMATECTMQFLESRKSSMTTREKQGVFQELWNVN